MDAEGVFRLTDEEVCRWARTYQMRIRSVRAPGKRSAHYARIATKDDNEVVAWLWFDDVGGGWIAFAPDDLTDEVSELFA